MVLILPFGLIIAHSAPTAVPYQEEEKKKKKTDRMLSRE